ncbi:hypothetical protein [Caudoviricetes sp.]|nr:hypothetical protein [Caudoviricetes sp.]
MHRIEAELVQSPAHYGGDWKIGIFIKEQNLNFFEGNIVKYICRYKLKNGVVDLIKARDYLDQLIQQEKDIK